MPGVLQYHVESWVWEIWRGVWADEKGVWGCVLKPSCTSAPSFTRTSPSLESPSPLAIASDAPVSELSPPFRLPLKTSELQTHYLPLCFATCNISPKHLETFLEVLHSEIFMRIHEDFHELLKLLATKNMFQHALIWPKSDIQLLHVKCGTKNYARKE